MPRMNQYSSQYQRRYSKRKAQEYVPAKTTPVTVLSAIMASAFGVFVASLFNRNKGQNTQIVGGQAPERNGLCPCGSGVKYKKCCWLTPAAQ